MTQPDDAWMSDDEAAAKTVTEEHVAWLLGRVDDFLNQRGWSEGYFSKRAAGDVNVIRRLRQAGKVTAHKMAEIEKFLDELSGGVDAEMSAAKAGRDDAA